MRKLASIQTVEELYPIPGADAIEVARVLGWKCIVKKGEFATGDLCVYFEIDSVLPKDVPALSFMSKSDWRVKTIKMRGQISQGLALPISSFPWLMGKPVGTNVSSMLGSGVTKHEDWGHMGPKSFGRGRSFPSFVRKTDEPRIQICARAMIDTLGPWYITEKLDGTSFTAYFHDGKFGVCSRNQDLDDLAGNLYWSVAKHYGLQESLPELCGRRGTSLAVQGEVLAPGVQGNWYGVKHAQLRVFGVYDIHNGIYVDLDTLVSLSDRLNLSHVPILQRGVDISGQTVDSLVDMAQGVSMLTDVQREGIVFRTHVETMVPTVGHASFKAINPVFLLKRKQ